MKIAFFVENIQFGGLDTFIINLLNNWNADDEIVLICNSSHPGLELLKSKLASKVNIIEHKILLTWDLDKYFNLPLFVLKFLKAYYFIVDIPVQVYMLKKFFKKNKFDRLMVINGGYPGGDSCISASIAWGVLNPKNKAWHNFHNLAYAKSDYRGLGKLKYYRSIVIDIFLSKHVKGFVSVSNNSIDSLCCRSSFKDNKKEHIYNGIDLDTNLENMVSIKTKYNLPNNAKVISVLGMYEPRKGQDFIIKVFQEVNMIDENIYLFMFGRGEDNYIDYLKKLIGDNKNIYLEDYQSNIKQVYNGTDILAIPSQSHESFGYTAVEAMAYKIPIVATNIGGLPEVVDSKVCGYVLDKDDIEKFAEKILFLCNDDLKRKEFGNNGYKRYQKLFKAKVMSDKYRKLVIGEIYEK